MEDNGIVSFLLLLFLGLMLYSLIRQSNEADFKYKAYMTLNDKLRVHIANCNALGAQIGSIQNHLLNGFNGKSFDYDQYKAQVLVMDELLKKQGYELDEMVFLSAEILKYV